MPAELTHFHRSIIKNMMLSQSYKHIGELLGFPVDIIEECVKELISDTSLVTHQQKLDLKKSLRQLPKSRAVNTNTKTYKAKVTAEEKQRIRNENERMHIDRKRRQRCREPEFKTIEVDYSKLVMVKVDERTIIYAKRGEEEKAKAEYLRKLSERKN